MNLVETKLLVAFLLGILRFLFGILPIKVYYLLLNWGEEGTTETIHAERHRAVECIIARIQSFGGGVLFATCFLHMIPEVRKSVNYLLEYDEPNDEHSEFPFSELIICIGFFMVYFIEEFTHWCVHNVRENKTAPSCHEPPIKYLNAEENNKVEEINNHINSASKNSIRSIKSSTYSDSSDSNSDDVILKSARSVQSKSHYTVTIEEKALKTADKENQKNIRGCLVVIALSVHSIFEGLSIGLQKSTGNIWFMFTAISIHASTILYCIGFEMAVEGIKMVTIIINMIILAVVSPLGIVVGLLFTLRSNMDTRSKTIAVCLLEGVSAGTVLYITFFEVLNREKNRRQHRISRCICILAGFGVMILLQTIDI
ncbi:zinc transporter ZIP3-like [Chrysoperla carnea]|uniref:zinc transporter ZIP3-like n=1 Tax=Chrysoperla carnea TaxID=189513 RepID=UPI001D0607E5|nr:zinc transporter ZIP3-like [Chrysoperla carnea]